MRGFAGQRMTAAADAAIPTHTVETAGFTWFMVSIMAIVAVTEPPGELM